MEDWAEQLLLIQCGAGRSTFQHRRRAWKDTIDSRFVDNKCTPGISKTHRISSDIIDSTFLVVFESNHYLGEHLVETELTGSLATSFELELSRLILRAPFLTELSRMA